MKQIFIFLSLLLTISWTCFSCNEDGHKIISKKYKEENIVYVCPDSIHEIKLSINGNMPRPYLIGDYLVIRDSNPIDYFFFVFDKKNMTYLGAFLPKGHGPGEICRTESNPVPSIDNPQCFFLLADNLKLLRVNIDSAITLTDYKPTQLFDWSNDKTKFPILKAFINKDEAIASIFEPTGNRGFNETIGKFNLQTGVMQKFDYYPSGVERKKVSIITSTKHNICAEVYQNYNLITLYDLNGNPKCNIYGPNWKPDEEDGKKHFSKAEIVGDKLLAGYSGKEIGPDHTPDRILVFDLDGNYIKSLHLSGQRIRDFCYDKEGNRLFVKTNDYILASLSLDGLL